MNESVRTERVHRYTCTYPSPPAGPGDTARAATPKIPPAPLAKRFSLPPPPPPPRPFGGVRGLAPRPRLRRRRGDPPEEGAGRRRACCAAPQRVVPQAVGPWPRMGQRPVATQVSRAGAEPGAERWRPARRRDRPPEGRGERRPASDGPDQLPRHQRWRQRQRQYARGSHQRASGRLPRGDRRPQGGGRSRRRQHGRSRGARFRPILPRREGAPACGCARAATSQRRAGGRRQVRTRKGPAVRNGFAIRDGNLCTCVRVCIQCVSWLRHFEKNGRSDTRLCNPQTGRV